ncbi:hypothetical protein GCK72_006897 [Caenorhabditis remanei]|uniref:Uncharacterized protein n=1 Tax=Caenorhabditis remanei TaxID=31234 RepID=E3M1R6_CAERE|nr:hypothetical protein GCK72_006897 [Caenorhabditis remanei]EFO88953.1 hypothetical protein CRE_06605 [Caenorhabditis remanei]KAF1766939.1 hypothetical protein GCK72_006897 [Caenorhabditis remanei]
MERIINFIFWCYEVLQPTPGGFDVFYALTAVLGFGLFHGVDNHSNKDLTYYEQLSAASPSTLHGYAAGVVSTILPIEALVTVVLPINYLVAYPELFHEDHHNTASRGIFLYSIFAGKCFGWRATMLLMAAGFGISPLFSTHHSSLAYEEELIYKMGFVMLLQIVTFSLFVVKNVKVEPRHVIASLEIFSKILGKRMQNWWTIFICRLWNLLGWSHELKKFNLMKDGHRGKVLKFFHLFSQLDEMKRAPERALDVIAEGAQSGGTVSIVSCKFDDTEVTSSGEELIASGSPEFKLFQFLKNKRPRSKKLKENFVKRHFSEGLQLCKEKGQVAIEGGYVRCRVFNWDKDTVKARLVNISRNVIPKNTTHLVELIDRGLINATITVSGKYNRNDHIQSHFTFIIPNHAR